ncbi:PAS domain-containing protein [Alkalihalobacillus pseudalcaliphilus]|uniref:PAS domain-containing protein n=1 Tax=Alkalihalobacillus pseudalcaliphilus TaxID=79884 RepID=UPI00064DA9D3|nr:PAS domain-containing protein [Alkalihalobacillus pseudalcaliphilus]KMK78117.1 hypothetical protein AB990_01340 [Alkalihalobacillus pseudalcaliphilus]
MIHLDDADLLKKIIDYAKTAIVITDPAKADNPIVYMSKGFSLMTGYQRQEVIGRNCRFMQGPDTDLQTVKKIKDAITNQTSFSAEILNYKKDGTPFWNQLTIDPVYFEKEKRFFFIGMQKDITEQKKTEQKYMDSVQLIESISNPIVPLFRDIAVLPLVGETNQERFNKLMATITESVIHLQIETLIIDLSGLDFYNELVLEELIRLKEVLNLVGTEMVICGMSPKLALSSAGMTKGSFNTIKREKSVKSYLSKYLEQLEKIDG